MTYSSALNRILTPAVVVFALAACGADSPAPESAEPTTAAPPTAIEAEPALNTLTTEQSAAGWQLLFDGTRLDAWRGYQLEGLAAGRRPGEGEGERGDLITREQYANFELTLDWAVTTGGNSGVMFRVSEDGDSSYFSGPEIQILDNVAHRDGLKAETSAGSNYAIHGPPSDLTRPIGEFNEARLRVDGAQATQWLNGVEQVSYELWSDEWTQLVAASKFSQWPQYGMNKSGHIVLQDHGNEIWIRNVKILVLDD